MTRGKKLGINNYEKLLPASGLPAMVITDNAELSGTRVDHFSRVFDVSMCQTGSYRADQKGTVEQSLRLLQAELKGLAEGCPSKEPTKKAGKEDTRPQTCLTLDNMRGMILRAAMMANTRLRDKRFEGMPGDVSPTPLNIWEYSKSSGLHHLKTVEDPKLLRILLLDMHPVSVSRNGILVDLGKGLSVTYFCKELDDRGVFEKRDPLRKKEFRRYRLAIDHTNLTFAYLFTDPVDKPKLYYTCELASKSAHYKNMTQTEAGEYKDVSAQAVAEAEAFSQKVRTAMLREQLEILNNAHKHREEYGGIAVTKDSVKDVVQNRRAALIQDEKDNPRMTADEELTKSAQGGYHKEEKTVTPMPKEIRPEDDDEDELSAYPSLDDDS